MCGCDVIRFFCCLANAKKPLPPCTGSFPVAVHRKNLKYTKYFFVFPVSSTEKTLVAPATNLFLVCLFLEVLTIAKLDHQLNEEIVDKEIRLIGADGAQLGIMSAERANEMAEEQGLDLVKISPNAVPPVCKIMDYSKFCYDQKKREKDAKKNQKVVEIKEIRMSPSIDTNDLNTKIKAATKFLSDGNRVKVSVRFRGREMAHTNIGEKLLMDFAEACAEVATMEKNPKLEGRFMAMFLTPKTGK